MAANTTPIFPLTPITDIVGGTGATAGTPGITANTTTDLTTGTSYLLHTASTNGSRVDYIKLRALGTNVATVIRIFINNGGVTSTATNNAMFMERTLAATTVSQTAELTDVVIPMSVSLPAGYKLYATFGTAVAAGFHSVVVGGSY
jgi:hypothetical protein